VNVFICGLFAQQVSRKGFLRDLVEPVALVALPVNFIQPTRNGLLVSVRYEEDLLPGLSSKDGKRRKYGFN
jgi:hypothetical protein